MEQEHRDDSRFFAWNPLLVLLLKCRRSENNCLSNPKDRKTRSRRFNELRRATKRGFPNRGSKPLQILSVTDQMHFQIREERSEESLDGAACPHTNFLFDQPDVIGNLPTENHHA